MSHISLYPGSLLALLIAMLMAIPCLTLTAGGGHRQQVWVERALTPITIDGQVNEGAWLFPDTCTLVQQSPSFGGQPSERTTFSIRYDDNYLYIAARLYDSSPADIMRNAGARDAEPPADWFEVSLDPYHDRRSGCYFRVTAAGGLLDGTISNETERNNSWNGTWDAAVTVDSLGWSVEMAIPFSQLRFNPGKNQIWGINLTRWIHRKNERIVLESYPPSFGPSAAYFADLAGLNGINPPSRMELLPHVSSQFHSYQPQEGNTLRTGRDLAADAGLDARYITSSGMGVVGTVNPDFSQVEVDPASVNLTTNETVYSEKRPFFTEGSGLFSFGDNATGNLFYSRRIGGPPHGTASGSGFKSSPQQSRILGAVKLTGKPGNSTSLGLLAAVTRREFATIDSLGVRREEEIEPATFYSALRDQHQFHDGSEGFGLFATTTVRDLRTAALRNQLNASTFSAGSDVWAYLDSGRSFVIRALGGFSYVTGSATDLLRLQQTPQRYFQRPDALHLHVDSTRSSMQGWNGELSLAKQTGNFTGSVTVTGVSPGFEVNDIGLLQQADRISASTTLAYGWFEPDNLFLSKSIGLSASRDFDFSGQALAAHFSLDLTAQFANGWGGSISGAYAPEGRDTRGTRGGPTILSPVSWNVSTSLYTDDRSGVSLYGNGYATIDEGGTRAYGYGGGISWRPSANLTLSLGPWWDQDYWATTYFSRIEDSLAESTFGARYIFAGLHQDDFSTDIRLEWTVTTRLSLRFYVQPYFSKIAYNNFKELARPGSRDFRCFNQGGATISDSGGEYIVDPDGAGPAPPFSLYNSDFHYNSLRGTASLQWEYLPGSNLNISWTHLRSVYSDYWTAQTTPDPPSLLKAHPDDNVVLKVSYLLGN